jgi:hypothetical protein
MIRLYLITCLGFAVLNYAALYGHYRGTHNGAHPIADRVEALINAVILIVLAPLAFAIIAVVTRLKHGLKL